MARKPRNQAGAFELGTLERVVREPLFWLDPNLKIVWVNRAWEEHVGRTGKEIRGAVCRAYTPSSTDPPDMASSFFPPPETLAGEPASVLTLITRPDGERLARLLEFWPFTDSQGASIGILGVIRPEDARSAAPGSRAAETHVELLQTRQALHARHGFDGMVGAGLAHRRLLEQVRLAATTSAPVLILGEEGTGKRLVAQTIHQLDPDRDQPLVPCDCQALVPEILERELFGTTRPDLAREHSGPIKPRLSLGPGSAFLLREILYLPRDLQARLAAAAGGSVRVFATSSQDPEAALADGRLAPELYYALTTLVLRLPALRDRRAEIPLLAQYFLERANERGGTSRTGFSVEALAALGAYDWPGNLRELARLVDHCQARALGREIELADLPSPVRGHLEASVPRGLAPRPSKPLDDLLIEIERRLIETALEQSHGNKSRAAEVLGISRPRLYRRIRELDLPDDETAGPGEADDQRPAVPGES